MTSRQRTPRSLRLLGVMVAGLLLVGTSVGISRTRGATEPADDHSGSAASDEPSERDPAPSPSPVPSPSPEPLDLSILEDPDLAEAAGAPMLLDTAAAAARGPWGDLGNPVWPVRDGRPTYVGAATLDPDRRSVTADVVVAFRADDAMSEVTLRLLPAADAVADVAGAPSVEVRRDGRLAGHTVDPEGARLLVPLEPAVAVGDAVLLRIEVSYRLADRTAIVDDGGPAGFGLLAYNPDASVLGHWLPLLTVPGDDGPMLPYGDVGAFPAGVWSVVVEHDGLLVSGGVDGECPPTLTTERACTWIRGTGLRDASAVVFDDATVVTRDAGTLELRSIGTVGEAALGRMASEALASFDSFEDRFGPLAWTEFDVVAAPLSSGAAGMEFPGLVVIDDEFVGALRGGFGTYVVAHEVAHQWFHALVGNGSLSSPVVDESLAQYLSYLYYADAYGEDGAQALAERYFVDRYVAARRRGLVDEPPAQPLADFEGDAAYGPLVYARGALAWIAAEEAVGRATVVAFLDGLVDEFGLSMVDDDTVLARADVFDPDLAAALERFWVDPRPLELG